MTAPSPLVEKVAVAIRSADNGIDGDSIAVLLDQSPLIEATTSTRNEADELILRVCTSAAQAALTACQAVEMRAALQNLLTGIGGLPVLILTGPLVEAVEASRAVLARQDVKP